MTGMWGQPLLAGAGQAAPGLSRAGVSALTCIRGNYAVRGVTVNALVPGPLPQTCRASVNPVRLWGLILHLLRRGRATT